MYITPLGHTECLLEIPNKQGKVIHLLVDAWLSDVCVADMMARRERVRIDYKSAPHIDLIFLSHSHLDHFDPYTLIEITRHHSPIILLPETCRFALPILKKYLRDTQIEVLTSRTKKEILGIEIEGIVWGSATVSNEEDVMTLLVSNQDTLIYHEIDTRLPFSESDREYFEQKIKSHQGKSLLLIESGNEIESQLRMLDTKRPGERNEISKEVAEVLADRLREEWQYLHDYDLYDPRHEPRATRAWIGQGITTPRELHKKLSEYHPLPLTELVKIESKTLKEYRLKPSVALLPGKRYEIQRNGGLKEIPSLKGINVESYTTHSDYRAVPFIERTGKSTFGSQLQLHPPTEVILDILNHRFVPYGLALSSDPLKLAILSSYRHSYPIALADEQGMIIESYSYDWSSGKYQKDAQRVDRKNASEIYLLVDLIDYLEGRQELYSTFVHKMEPGKFGRLWTTLGANFINLDLQTKKLTYHFERALS